MSRDSATRHASVGEAHSVETDHSGLNKCATRTDPPYTNLKSAICRLRSPSLLEQADAFIRSKCYSADRLKIERLSGQLLAMDQCYINLAIVEQSRQEPVCSSNGGPTKPSPFSLLARQKLDQPNESVQIELAAIFSQRQRENGRLLEPRRILIRGRAGVGKTTLCKKIIHEFSRGTWSDWNKRFDRVLWVPLRNLKLPERRQTPAYNLEDLVKHEYFSLPSRPDLARRLSHALEYEDNSTLFILDGLDEVSQDLGGTDDMARFLDRLLRYRNVIITTRPNATHSALQDIDLELETIGFYPDQVHDYIEKTFIDQPDYQADKGKVKQVRSFLDRHWVIQGLARIPIQLDALCYTWDDLQPNAIPNTMTGMYREIEQKLWKKDSVRLGKKSDGDARLSRPAEIRSCITDELEIIENLAFSGLYRDVIDFTPAHRDEILGSFPQLQLRLPLDETLDRLSFLRSSNPSSKYKYRSYHFIHLTFQEYFAASYFVRQWKQTAKLRLLAFGGNAVEPVSPTEFLRKQKYTGRYDIFWRFVAGMLDMYGRPEEFIDAIEEEPLDLLGPTHQRLVMHCFGEISSNWPTRETLVQELGNWLSFGCIMYRNARLAAEAEFPDQVLQVVLREQPARTQETILRWIVHRASIPPRTISAIASLLQSHHKYVRIAAIAALKWQDLPYETLRAVAARLYDKDINICLEVLDFLCRPAAIPSQNLNVMIAKLRHKDSRVRSAAIKGLSRQAVPPNEIFQSIVARSDEDSHVRSAAIQALGERAAISSRVRTVTTAPHETQQSESDGILRFLVAQLGGSDRKVQDAATDALLQQTSLSDEIMRATASFLDTQDSYTRKSAVEVLGHQVSIPDEILSAMVPLLTDKIGIVRKSAIEALGWRELPADILRAMVSWLRSQNSHERASAVAVLGYQASTSNEILSTMLPLVNDQVDEVRYCLAEALGRRVVPLPEEILRAMVELLGHKNSHVQASAINALSRQSMLSSEILTALTARLKDDEYTVRWAASQTLERRGLLSSETLSAFVNRIHDPDENARWFALGTLGHQAMLPNEILTLVAARLEDEYLKVRARAETVLRRHDEFYRGLLQGPRAKDLYRILLEKSFMEQLSLYMTEDNTRINFSDGTRVISIDARGNNFREMVQSARPANYPPAFGSSRERLEEGQPL